MLKWASSTIWSLLGRSYFGEEGFFRELYSKMMITQSLITQLWDQSFSKKVVEEKLMLNLGDWDRALSKQIEFIKAHNIKNERLNHLKEELDLVERLKHIERGQCFAVDRRFRTIPYQRLHTKVVRWKDQSSFFGFRGKQLCLVEKYQLYFSAEVENGQSNIQDAVYIPKENAYFFCTREFLYGKQIDRGPPKVVIDIGSDLPGYTSLLYTKKKHRLIINCGDRIILFNLRLSKIEVIVQKPDYVDESDQFLKVLPLQSEPSKLIFLSSDGKLALSKISERQASNPIEHISTPLYHPDERRDEYYDFEEVQIGLCPREKYLLIGNSGREGESSHFTIFEIFEDSFSLIQDLTVPAQEAKLYRDSSPFSSSYFSSYHLIFSTKMKRYAVVDDDHRWFDYDIN